LRQVLFEQRELRSVRVVVVDRADLLEQLGAARVVEQLARQVLAGRAKPREDVVTRERVEAQANGAIRRFHPRLLTWLGAAARDAATLSPLTCQANTGHLPARSWWKEVAVRP